MFNNSAADCSILLKFQITYGGESGANFGIRRKNPVNLNTPGRCRSDVRRYNITSYMRLQCYNDMMHTTTTFRDVVHADVDQSWSSRRRPMKIRICIRGVYIRKVVRLFRDIFRPPEIDMSEGLKFCSWTFLGSPTLVGMPYKLYFCTSFFLSFLPWHGIQQTRRVQPSEIRP